MSMDWPEPIGLDETVRRLPPGKWYYLSASVKANGDGTIYIDNKVVAEESLDAALAAVEAALPEGWSWRLARMPNETEHHRYSAWALHGTLLKVQARLTRSDSAAASLRALEARLRGTR